MLTVYLAVAMLLLVAVAGAPLARLADLRLRHSWLLWAALFDQIVVISVLPDSHPTALALAHIASYLAAGICLVVNRKLPGIWFIGGGGGLNGLVIALNGGVLPATDTAAQASGQEPRLEHFNNSAVLDHPRLPLLGDIFATPAWLPGHNVFSVGDIAIWAGLAWLLWRTCQPLGRRSGARHRLTSGRGPHAS
jgi:hypothetical protein